VFRGPVHISTAHNGSAAMDHLIEQAVDALADEQGESITADEAKKQLYASVDKWVDEQDWKDE
jgi:ribosome-associated translation inhibitor RaiA